MRQGFSCHTRANSHPGRSGTSQANPRLPAGSIAGTCHSASGTTPDPYVRESLTRRNNTLAATATNDAASLGQATTRGGIPNRNSGLGLSLPFSANNAENGKL
jgi:hypothetical protein